MPNIIITEADFEKLSTGVKTEIWELLQNSFSSNTGSTASLAVETTDQAADINPASFEVLSIETAIAVLVGLSEESRHVVASLCMRQLTRNELTEILGNEKKINGTIGSINRRLIKRLSESVYGKRRDRVKLIEFDEKYRLSCDSRSLEIALLIINKGYKFGAGDIVLKFGRGDLKGEVRIEEEAIIQIDAGEALVLFQSWDYYVGQINMSISINVICSKNTSRPDKIVVSTLYEDEWEPDSYSGNYYPAGNPSEIHIGSKKR
ncbi:hypothetical protein OAR42_04500 [Planktomarina temperata]|nr:hypothetical protein [Planktomarina temperata]MDC6462632.1 hypothetical protein [Planktomarina temperata]